MHACSYAWFVLVAMQLPEAEQQNQYKKEMREALAEAKLWFEKAYERSFPPRLRDNLRREGGKEGVMKRLKEHKQILIGVLDKCLILEPKFLDPILEEDQAKAIFRWETGTISMYRRKGIWYFTW